VSTKLWTLDSVSLLLSSYMLVVGRWDETEGHDSDEIKTYRDIPSPIY
jgi:hypothetical protein